MTTSPPKGIYDILVAASGLPTGFLIVVGEFEDAPDKQLVIRATGGRGAELSSAIDYPSVQLLCRGSKGQGGYDAAFQMIDACRLALIGIPSGPAAWPELTSCVPIGEIQQLMRDDKARQIFSYNMRLIVSYTTSGYRIL